MTATQYNVLFLCIDNAARSPMAETILNREAAGRFHGFSAGIRPAAELNPTVANLLGKLNHPVDSLYPKSWHDFTVPGAPLMDFIFAVCDEPIEEPLPQWPGQPLFATWGLPNPLTLGSTEAERAALVGDTYRMLSNRVGVFVNLPMPSLDRLALAGQLNAIGHMARS